jgi:cysteinyl-tRNA synthetase
VRDLLDKGYSGRAIRYWLLAHNYQKPLSFTFEAINQANGALKRLDECIYLLNHTTATRPYSDLDQLLYDLKTGFAEAMDNDLDIAQAMATIFQNVRKINRLVTSGQLDAAGAKEVKKELIRIDEVVNIFDFEDLVLDSKVQDLVREREKARHNKDWARADKIREQLYAMGLEVKDNKTTP